MELEKEWWSPMSSTVCSIPLISPIGVPSPLHTTDQLPLYISSLYLCACVWACVFVCILAKAGQTSHGHKSSG